MRRMVDVSMSALETLTGIARDAGDLIMEFYDAVPDVAYKADASPLTAADRAAHAVILRALQAWDETIPVVSEEGEIPSYNERRSWPRFWLVDPLDGTKEFLARNGEFTVNIALIDRGEPTLGVVHAPALDLTYVAAAGLGAWRSSGTQAPTRLAASASPARVTRIVESRSHPNPRLEAFLAGLGPIQRIPLGSSLKFCRVAEGEADLYPRFGPTMEWDVAAGDCIFRCSSGAGSPRRSPLVYNQPTLTIPEFVIGASELPPLDGRGGPTWNI